MIKFHDLDAGYVGRRPVLRGVEGSLRSGNVYGLLGANGSGKTTLLKTLAGGLFPLRGEVEASGRVPSQRSRDFLADTIYMPDEVAFPSMSLDSFERVYSRFRPRFSHDDFREYLRMLDFDCDTCLDRLSTGNRKKVFIAYALAGNPSTVLMDEPTNGLDIESKKAFRRLLAGFDMTDRVVVVSTHQVADLENLLTAAIVVREGTIALNALFDEITARLAFGNAGGEGEPLYADGLRAIRLNRGGEYTDVDVELLYHAIHESEAVRDFAAAHFSGKEGVC